MNGNVGKPGVHEGFPNPAIDGTAVPLDLNQLVVKNPTSTFYMRVGSSSYESLDIFKGDIVVIDRSLSARPKDLIVAAESGEFAILPLPKHGSELELWGVITCVIHKTR